MSDRSETKQPADEGRLDRRVRRVVDARELATHSEIADAVRGIEKERRDAMRELMRDFDQSYYYPNLKDMREACGRIGHKWRFSHHGPLGDPWFLCGVCHAHECRPERESAELAAERARGDAAVAEAAEHKMFREESARRLAQCRVDRDRLRAAGRSLLACPHIAERDTDPDWVDAETEAAVAEMRDALKEGGQ